MSFVVLDTDAASHLFRGRVDEAFTRHMLGSTLAITYVTVGEMTKWTLVRRWGPQRLAKLQAFFSELVIPPTAHASQSSGATYRLTPNSAAAQGRRMTRGSRRAAWSANSP